MHPMATPGIFSKGFIKKLDYIIYFWKGLNTYKILFLEGKGVQKKIFNVFKNLFVVVQYFLGGFKYL